MDSCPTVPESLVRQHVAELEAFQGASERLLHETFLLDLVILFHVYFPACLYMCITCMLDAQRSQKRTSDLLQLELQIVIKHFVGTRNRTLAIWKSNKYSLTAELSLQALAGGFENES